MKEKKERTRLSFKERKSRGRLSLNVTDGEKERFQFRWVADRPGRIEDLKETGYEEVTRNNISGGTIRHAGTHDGGAQMKNILMRIPREYYDEDLEEKRSERESIMGQIRKDPAQEARSDVSGVSGDLAHFDMKNSKMMIETG